MAERDIYTCYYCTIGHHKSVECGGIYYCPNPLCSGPGAAWLRAQCKSYKEEAGGRHSVDWSEWRRRALEVLREKDGPDDEAVWAAFYGSEKPILAAEVKERLESNANRLNLLHET